MRAPVFSRGLEQVWMWLSIAAAAVAWAGSVVGLLIPAAAYGRETALLFSAVIAQDLVNAVLVAPLLVVLAVRARRGFLGSWLLLPGFLSFTVYNYAIYAFSIQFGPLFLVWVAVLGLSVFALLGSLSTVLPVQELMDQSATRLAGWVLLSVSALFALLWLREIIPNLVAGVPSTSAADWNVPTNPVHVLDLAFFLPAVFASGMLLLQRHRLGYATAIGSLGFLGLTTLPIMVTPVVSYLLDEPAGWSILVPMGILALLTWAVILRQVRSIARVTA